MLKTNDEARMFMEDDVLLSSSYVRSPLISLKTSRPECMHIKVETSIEITNEQLSKFSSLRKNQ
jgi:hypothetical protein